MNKKKIASKIKQPLSKEKTVIQSDRKKAISTGNFAKKKLPRPLEIT